VEVEVVWIFVLLWQAVMQVLEAMPANAPLDLLDRFLFPDQDAQSVEVQRITGLQFADREVGGEGCLTHGINTSDALQNRSAVHSGEAPVWDQLSFMRAGLP
jgi:hypothetical protein